MRPAGTGALAIAAVGHSLRGSVSRGLAHVWPLAPLRWPGDQKWNALLVAETRPRPGDRVLVLGRGSAALGLSLKRAYPAARLTALDLDARAGAWAARAGLEEGLSIELRQESLADAALQWLSIDLAVSRFLSDQMAPDDERRTLWEVFELLKPCGEIQLVAWNRPSESALRSHLEEAGFRGVRVTRRQRSLLRTAIFYRATKAV